MRMMAQRGMLTSLLAVWLAGATGCGGSSTPDCTPQCSGKTCGADGCGGSCGTCGATQTCNAAGACVACTPQCSGKTCGSDGCGGSCGTCSAAQTCNASGMCVACAPQCSGKTCGADGCGGSCGTCGATQTCNAAGACVACTPQCSGKTCGSDGCGATCGTCSGTQICNAAGTCIALSPVAQAVGAYSQVGTTCASGSTWTGYGMFLCPGGKIRGAGTMDSATELICGDYTASAPVYANCTDRYGCFPKVTATVKDTLIIGGISDVAYGFVFSMYLIDSAANHDLHRGAQCKDGSGGNIVLRRIAVDVTDNYCNSAACPQSGGSGGGSGTCGTDCDCGHCWYCDTSGSSNTCRYGGEGPYGCYRGCGG